MSLSITFGNLYVIGEGGAKLPIEKLNENPRYHIHGLLEIAINGRKLPYLGYWGPDDVCFDTWLNYIKDALIALSGESKAHIVFDEGEQGQPAFLLRRCGDFIEFSIVASSISDADGDPEWQGIRIEFSQFVMESKRFMRSLKTEITQAAPAGGEGWWKRVVGNV